MLFSNLTEAELKAIIQGATKELDARKFEKQEKAIDALQEAWANVENAGVRITTEFELGKWFELTWDDLYFD